VPIIGIAGSIGSGKDTVGKIIQGLTLPIPTEREITTSPWQIRKYADKLKEIAALFLGVDRERFEDQDYKNSMLGYQWCTDMFHQTCLSSMTVREFLQRLGTEAVRDNLHRNAWVNALYADYTDDSNWIITDVRFPNEFEAVKERGGVMIKVERENNPHAKSYHMSEVALDKHGFDYTIHNIGSYEQLVGTVSTIYEDIGFHVYQ
jgi:hypothetical protein